MGGEAVACFGDVCSFDDAGRLIEKAVKTYGHMDILVNNAAGLGHGTIMDTTPADWEYQTAAKLTGAYNMMHHAVKQMLRQGGDTILNCASNAWTGQPNLCAYSAGNAGVVGLTWAAAKELNTKNITVNAFCPQAASPGHEEEFNKMAQTMQLNLDPSAAINKGKLAKGDVVVAKPNVKHRHGAGNCVFECIGILKRK